MSQIIGYHYTNPSSYRSMQNGYTYGRKGLLPINRFLRFDWGQGLPDEAHAGVVDGLLEPEPESWLKNKKFPGLFELLIGSVSMCDETLLLSFEIKPEDRAYVVERAHKERFLRNENLPREEMNQACKSYWESRVPVADYKGDYSVPQLAIWSTIPFERLKVEWVKPSLEIRKDLLKKCG